MHGGIDLGLKTLRPQSSNATYQRAGFGQPALSRQQKVLHVQRIIPGLGTEH